MDVRTRITRSRNFEKQLDKIPDFIQKKVLFWIFLVETNGIWEVMKSPGFHDEPLKGQRKGQRSVRMNKAYRLIYHIIEDSIHIELLEVHKHEY
ncbi:MAG: type II toxin-antitoxin system RelE family toxin [Pseudobdellovibrio sp.]